MQTKTGIIFLQRDKFQLYSPYATTLFEFRFVPEIIQDFDLVNHELLENLLKVFLINNKIAASSLVIVISDNASFIKDFVLPPTPIATSPSQPQNPSPTLADLQTEANRYLEHVPFEDVASKTFPLANGVRAYATNQEMIISLKNNFEKFGFIVSGVFPAFIFDQGISNRPFDGASITLILQKIPTLREYNLLNDTSELPLANVLEEREEVIEEDIPSAPGENNKKMIFAVGISVILLIFVITGAILYYQFANPPYKPPPQAQKQIPQVSPTQAVQTENTSGTVAIGEIEVQIIYATSSATKAQQLRTQLAPTGFKTITLQLQNNLESTQPRLLFSPRVDIQTKSSITTQIQQVLPNVVIQEKDQTKPDISIILGR